MLVQGLQASEAPGLQLPEGPSPGVWLHGHTSTATRTLEALLIGAIEHTPGSQSILMAWWHNNREGEEGGKGQASQL